MKALLAIIITNLLSLAALCQTDFTGDAAYPESSRTSKIYSVVDSSFKLDKDNDFEFRFWTLPSMTNFASVFIIMQRQGQWKGRYFEYQKTAKGNVIEHPVNQSKLDSLWKRLVANQVLTLPTFDSLRSKMKIYIADTSYALDEEDMYKRVMITDGSMYRFELADKSKRRAYDYHCPQGYLKHHPNLEELYRAFAIIVLIRKYLGLQLTVC